MDDFLKTRDLRHPYYKHFFEIAKDFDVVVELGSWQGTSAACFAAGGAGLVITVDHHSDPGDDWNKQMTMQAEAYYDNLIYCQGWTCDRLYEEEKDLHSIPGKNAFPKVTKALGKKKIDLLFIDSWHRYDQAMKDWEAYKPLLNKGALIICDDLLEGNIGDGIEGMWKFWTDLVKEGKRNQLRTDLHEGYPMGFLWM